MPRRSKNVEVAALESSIEGHVAGRIRLRRGLLGMSQSDLARTLGITFQQVQKYERGSNRVSVGKLYRLAEILDVPLTFFFDGLEQSGTSRMGDTMDTGGEGHSPILSRRELDVMRAWKCAPPAIADAVASLLRSVTPGAVPEAEEVDVPAAAPAAHAAPAEAPIERKPKPAAAEVAVPKRRGRPPKVVKEEAPAVGTRRRRNAVWDPSDIHRASREKG